VRYSLRLTEAQRTTLCSHLFPGDGNEAVALMLCGRRNGAARHVLTVRRVLPIPHGLCVRRPDRVTWPTDFVDNLLKEAYGNGQAVVKVHSHPAGYAHFSKTDDESDRVLFSSVTSLMNDGLPHASVIMTADGEMAARILGEDGRVLSTDVFIMSVGDDIRLWGRHQAGFVTESSKRNAQAFGKGTTELLRSLAIAVVGCSGTGSIVVEQLARLGVGKLVLIDPESVEEANLNRMLNSGKEDVFLSRPKVHVLASAIARMGLAQEVVPLQKTLLCPEAVRAVAECDVVFGCMDGAEGRHTLNRVATFYMIPYLDVGVRLDADGRGGVNQIAGTVHYLQPGRSSLLSRGVYTMSQVNAEGIRRTNPELYRRRVREGYLRGIEEDRPAVISVNMFFSALAVNELLARLHPYRNQPNSHLAIVAASLSEVQFYPELETAVCAVLQRHVGRGDVMPLLERPALSE
jgi:hypothetical protein